MPPLGRYGESIADLILRQGDVQARNAMMSGQIWSNAIQNIGQAGAQAYEGYRKEKRQKQISDEFTRLVSNPQTWQDNPQATMSRLVPLVGAKGATELMRAISGIAETQMKAQKYQMDARTAAREDLPNLAALQHNTPMGARDEALTSFLTRGLEAAGYPTDNPYETLEGIYKGSQEPRVVKTVDAQGNPVERLVNPEELVQGVPTYEKPKEYQVTVPGPEGPVTRLATEGELRQGVREYQKPPASLVVNPQSEEDVRTNAEMLLDGRAIPTTFGKRGKDFNHMIAVADKMAKERGEKGYDALREGLKYEGAKRFVGNMNSNQMIRFKALAGSVVNTIDEVKLLSEALKQGGIQKWNQAKRNTILQVYGNTPQSDLAARYVGAVNTLKEEFANLAQGGYAPTDAAWKLSNEQINSDFGLKDLTASLNEVQRLINYRIRAFDELSPYQPGGTTQPEGSGAGEWHTLPNGVRYRVKP